MTDDLKRMVRAKEKGLDDRLRAMKPDALAKFHEIKALASIQSFHAYIGSNNNSFVDSVRMKFDSPEDFKARWIDGLKDKVIADADNIRNRRSLGRDKQTTEILPETLQDDFLKEYVYLFLERNFYRNFNERMRSKPDEMLWQLWFGSGGLVWGLLISPDRRLGEWTNDKSQMRREPYEYWTISHVLASGLIVPECETPYKFDSLEGFLSFYETVLARVSQSEYEKYISKSYLEYVRSSQNPESIPLLIPELRYTGKEKNHKYRLDFCVLNSYTMKMIGFEISPSSSHMSISGIKSKTQKVLNEDLSTKWDKESEKRNSYFEKYGITTITFTDKNLKDLEQCFSEIVKVLEERPERKSSIKTLESSLMEAFLNI
jgi:hypothetical protein